MPTLSVLTAIALFTGAAALVGLVILGKARARTSRQIAFTVEYREQASALLEQGEGHTYEWLTLNATRMQAQMGSEGICSFRPPHASHVVNNYPIVVNALSELRKFLSDELLSRGNLPVQYQALLDDALMRHQGPH